MARALPDILVEFQRTHPGVDLELTVGSSESLESRMAAGELDLVFGKRPPGEKHSTLLWRDRLVWAGPSAAREFDDPVPFVTYPEPSLTRQRALRALKHAGRACRVTCVSDSLLGLRAAVLAGLGIIAHAAGVLPDGLVPLTDPRLPELGELDFVLMQRRTRLPDPVQALADAIAADARRLSLQTTRAMM